MTECLVRRSPRTRSGPDQPRRSYRREDGQRRGAKKRGRLTPWPRDIPSHSSATRLLMALTRAPASFERALLSPSRTASLQATTRRGSHAPHIREASDTNQSPGLFNEQERTNMFRTYGFHDDPDSTKPSQLLRYAPVHHGHCPVQFFLWTSPGWSSFIK